MAALERRAIDALRAFGVLMTDTCINYQTIHGAAEGRARRLRRHRRRHLFEQRARRAQQFRGRPVGFGGGVDRPDPALRLPSRRMPTRDPALSPDREAAYLAEWGAVGGIVGEACSSYWQVPCSSRASRPRRAPTCSSILAHRPGELRLGGLVPHAGGHRPRRGRSAARHPTRGQIGRAEIDAFLARYAASGDKLDVVVFGAPQLSLFEIEAVAQALDGRRVHPDTWIAGYDLARDQARPPTAWG